MTKGSPIQATLHIHTSIPLEKLSSTVSGEIQTEMSKSCRFLTTLWYNNFNRKDLLIKVESNIQKNKYLKKGTPT